MQIPLSELSSGWWNTQGTRVELFGREGQTKVQECFFALNNTQKLIKTPKLPKHQKIPQSKGLSTFLVICKGWVSGICPQMSKSKEKGLKRSFWKAQPTREFFCLLPFGLFHTYFRACRVLLQTHHKEGIPSSFTKKLSVHVSGITPRDEQQVLCRSTQSNLSAFAWPGGPTMARCNAHYINFILTKRHAIPVSIWCNLLCLPRQLYSYWWWALCLSPHPLLLMLGCEAPLESTSRNKLTWLSLSRTPLVTLSRNGIGLPLTVPTSKSVFPALALL